MIADTFNNWFEPENLRSAQAVLAANGFRVEIAKPTSGKRPLCCGRTYLTNGMVRQAKQEMERVLDALRSYLEEGIPIVGLEPSCMLGMRDEIPVLMRGGLADSLAESTFLFEEFLERNSIGMNLNPMKGSALIHGHCHQKSFDQMSHVERTLRQIPELSVETINAGCCGMAGAFGYDRETYRTSELMAELDLYPKIRESKTDSVIVADGFSCRHQIELGTGRKAVHAAQLLNSAMQSS